MEQQIDGSVDQWICRSIDQKINISVDHGLVDHMAQYIYGSVELSYMKFIPIALAKMIVVFFFCAKKLFRKMSAAAEVKTVSDLETRLSQIKILCDEIAPVIIQEWLGTYTKSHWKMSAINQKLTDW